MKDSSRSSVDGQPDSSEFTHVSDVAVAEAASLCASSLTTEQIYRLVEMLLKVAYERERQAGVL